MSVFDPVFYAVSALLWLWHQVFGALLGPASGAAWTLAVVFLVLTLRALVLRPALEQFRSAAVLRTLRPQLAALRGRHADDPVRLLRETTALQRAHGVTTWRTLIPMLVQAPVLLGLLHVLQGFRDPAAANYAFAPVQVASFLDARLFGAPLSAYLSMPQALLDGFGVDRLAVAAVAVPLMLLAAVATHLTARYAASRQPADGVNGTIQRAMPWVAPLGVLGGGLFFPFAIGVLTYWLTSNVWTLGQQWWGLRWAERRMPGQTSVVGAVTRDAAPAVGATSTDAVRAAAQESAPAPDAPPAWSAHRGRARRRRRR